MRTLPASTRGFSILETMIAMVVLGIGLVGALAALQRGATESRLGQTRQMKMMLAESALQRVKLQDKRTLFAGLPAQPTTNIANLAVGTSPWVPDPTTTTDPLDFSEGAYFNILPDGTVVPITTITAGTACNAAAVPLGTICREVYSHLNGPYDATNVWAAGSTASVNSSAIPSATQVATNWVRVTRKTSATDRLDAEVDVVLYQVVVQ
jgi:prepilin-type N-terminal cleavage/methylation domain-containing protein